MVFAALGFCTYQAVKYQLQKNLGDNQIRRSRIIASSLVADIARTGEDFVSEQIRTRFAPEQNGWFIRVQRSDGSVLYASDNLQQGALTAPTAGGATVTPREPWREIQELRDGKKLLLGKVAIETTAGRYIVESGALLESLQGFLMDLLSVMLFGFPLLLAISVTGGHLLVKKALQPVQKACRSAEEITLQNLSQRLPALSTGDELNQLTMALNRMITRLEDAVMHNHRFMADASHEMRTPLTIVRGELEAVVKSASLPETSREALGSVLEEVERLTNIVENLFAIARLDAGEIPVRWSSVDLAALARMTAEQMLLLAEDKEISITTVATQPVCVEGDRSRLKQVIVNLLDNAIKYTPAGGRIELVVSESGQSAILDVIDNGIGIPTEAQAHVFERFYRVDKARSREMGGAGLGLAIVKTICASHGGTVKLESKEGVGSRFRVELPKAIAVHVMEISGEHRASGSRNGHLTNGQAVRQS